MQLLRFRRVNPVTRAIAVFGVVATLVTGITYAALTSQATLTNNIISSASANLQVKSTGSFATQDAGFAFTGIVPGGPAMPLAGNAFQLRNAGDTDLDVAVSVPALPTFVGGTVDPSKVDLLISCTAGSSTFAKTASLADLVAAHGTGGLLMTPDYLPHTTGNVADCTAKVQMDSDAITGSGPVSTTFFNIVFTGTVHTLPS
ncbi:MAG: hypothetical protein KIH63_001375 [Candidatus Saccharibacteria bacterium]|nr:hypothetical protein [Candidatus Saccharibacteria bacterium]